MCPFHGGDYVGYFCFYCVCGFCVRLLFCDVVKMAYQLHNFVLYYSVREKKHIETILDIHVLYVIMTAFYSYSNIVYTFKVSLNTSIFIIVQKV